MALDEPQDGETATEIDGVDVLISRDTQSLTGSTTIDYERGAGGGVFTIGLEVFPDF